MLTDVVFQDLGDESFQGSAARSRLLKHPRALLVAFNRALNCFNLAFDALEAVQQFRPVSFNMSHL